MYAICIIKSMHGIVCAYALQMPSARSHIVDNLHMNVFARSHLQLSR